MLPLPHMRTCRTTCTAIAGLTSAKPKPVWPSAVTLSFAGSVTGRKQTWLSSPTTMSYSCCSTSHSTAVPTPDQYSLCTRRQNLNIRIHASLLLLTYVSVAHICVRLNMMIGRSRYWRRQSTTTFLYRRAAFCRPGFRPCSRWRRRRYRRWHISRAGR